MENNPEASRTSNGENVAEFMGKIMVTAILVVVFLTILFVCLQILFNRLFCRRPTTTTPRSRQLGTEPIPPQRGLNPNILKSLPVVIITPKLELNERLECAVCLSEFCEGERARFLPKCRHGFHVECIDEWFHSHSNCPLCRNPVTSADDSAVTSNNGPPSGGPAEEDKAAATTSSSMVVDVRGGVEEEEEEDVKSGIAEGFRRLKRLLTGNSRADANASTSGIHPDIEQGQN